VNRDQNPTWQIWIDTGGTFTDCLALDSSGTLHRAKVLSHSALRGFVKKQLDRQRLKVQEKWQVPSDFIRGFRFKLLERNHLDLLVEKYDSEAHILELNKPLAFDTLPNTAFEVCSSEEAPILAARLVTKTCPEKPLPDMVMRLATTRGTNALLERKGIPTALFITKGFGDLLLIGTQQRPDLFALEIRKPKPLYEAVVEVEERLAADGSVLRPINLNGLISEIEGLRQQGIGVAAVALMHSYRNARHEQKLASFLRSQGFQHVSCSSDLAPFIKLLPRAETTVVDAYLASVIKDYLLRVNSALPGGRLQVMTSAGGLVQAEAFKARDSLLSGPAGGVVGAALAARQSGFNKIIAFDMGGTSTDVARYDTDYEYVFEYQVGDAHLVAPALAIESVAAGGGSICSFDGASLQVGPESAGAQPGPACYGAGGPLTLTDVNLLLGRLDPEQFEIPINSSPAELEFQALCKKIKEKTSKLPDKEELLQGFLEIANERMADAIRRISLRQGYDPKNYALVAFGGAGGQHACGVAKRLGVETILIPKDASLLSAFGIGHAVVERFAEKQILQQLDRVGIHLPKWIKELEQQSVKAVEAEGMPANNIEVRRRILNLRFIGQDSVLSVEYDKKVPLQQAFEKKYSEIFGHRPEGRQIELESIRVIASSRTKVEAAVQECLQAFAAKPEKYTRTYFKEKWEKLPIYERSRLAPGASFVGPALVFEQHSATVIEAGWKAEVDGAGALLLKFLTEP
jgi:5-oxoprolinase (ATP-hydrolysing)